MKAIATYLTSIDAKELEKAIIHSKRTTE